MKQLSIAVLGLFCLVSSTAADVILWKQSITVTITGGGSKTYSRIKGWALTDGETGNFVFLKVFPDLKRFSIERPLNGVYYPESWKGKQSMVVAVPSLDVGIFMAKGYTSSSQVGPTKTYIFSKTMTVSGSAVQFDGSNDILQEYRGTMTYDRSSTQTMNDEQKGVEGSIENFRSYYAGAGWTEQ